MNSTLANWRQAGPRLTRSCRQHSTARYSTSPSSAGPDHSGTELLPFTRCGVRPVLARALASSFNITTPNALQANLLTLLARSPNRDMIVRNATGSGKSFALAVGLVNAPRSASVVSAATSSENKRIQPAHMLLVPHPDLAHQLTRWIHAMVPADLHAQVVAQALPNLPDPIIDNPHVLIGTPSRVLDLMASGALDPRAIGTLALDEVDQLTPPIPRWDVQRASVRRRHPRPVEVLVAQLAAHRSGSSSLAEMPGDELVRMLTATEGGKDSRLADAEFKAWLRGKPRIAAVSATASSVVRTHLVSRLKWMHPRRWAFVNGEQHVVGQRVRHCALVVEAGKEQVTSLGVVERQTGDLAVAEDKKKPQASVMDLVSSLVAYARATDVKHALVVALGDIGVNRAVDEFNKLFNVRATVWSSSSSTSPQPYISASDPWIQLHVVSYGGIRGLDIPDLTHVFLLGAPADVSEYQHIAGRVGRLGGSSNTKNAMVVTFCDVKGGERLRQIWRWMGDKKVRIELVDAEVVDKVKFGGTL